MPPVLFAFQVPPQAIRRTAWPLLSLIRELIVAAAEPLPK
jgi:hypothetical protein